MPRALQADWYRWDALRMFLKVIGLLNGEPDAQHDR
jgi:hypothetical protein